jgi:protein TonB
MTWPIACLLMLSPLWIAPAAPAGGAPTDSIPSRLRNQPSRLPAPAPTRAPSKPRIDVPSPRPARWAPAASPPSPAPARPGAPDGRPEVPPIPKPLSNALMRWIESARSADSGRVMRLEVHSASGKPALWNTSVAGESRVERAWIEEFAHLLESSAPFDSAGRCVPEQDPSSGPADQLVLAVQIEGQPAPVSAVWLKREGCIDLLAGDRAAGRAEATPATAALLDLARRALPQDTVIEQLALFHGDEPSVANPGIVIVPPTPEELPKFGDYVYVTELPEAIVKVPPQYPTDAREKGVDGTVLVQALVGRDGTVRDVRVQKSIRLLDAAAVQAVYQWRFKPALSEGKPVAVWVAVPVRFALR